MLQIASSDNSAGLPVLGLFFNPPTPSFSYLFSHTHAQDLFLWRSPATYEQIFCLDKQRQEQVAFFPLSLHLVHIYRSFQTMLWLGSSIMQDDDVISLAISIYQKYWIKNALLHDSLFPNTFS